MTELATIHVTSIAAGGRGVGRLGGMAVFVPRAAPDETVEIDLTRHRRYGEGRVRRVLHPSPVRVLPACRHYERDRCGGCQLQHLDYGSQLGAKRQIIADALSRLARRDAAVNAVEASPIAWEYRNKLTLTLRPRGGTWIAGLRPWDNPDEIFPLEECPITAGSVVLGWREVMSHAKLLPRARELRGSVRVAGSIRSFVLRGASSWNSAAAFAHACASLDVVHWVDDAGNTHVIREPASPTAPAAFEQVNPPVAAQMHAYVVALVRRGAPRRVIDTYAGRGATAAALAADGCDVVAIELDPAAVRLARQVLGAGRVFEARVEDELPRRLPADAVVLNPPRAGLDARVCAALSSATPRPARIVYVSCDPATLARDLTRLTAFRVESVQPFDMFPQTAHVETVCELVPETL